MMAEMKNYKTHKEVSTMRKSHEIFLHKKSKETHINSIRSVKTFDIETMGYIFQHMLNSFKIIEWTENTSQEQETMRNGQKDLKKYIQ